MITVLFGGNRYALRSRLKEIETSFAKEYGSAGVERHAAERVETTQLASLVAGASLFAVNRLVIITDVSSNKLLAEAFEKLATQVPDEVHVILVESALDKRTTLYKTLKKHAELEEFAQMDELAAQKWVSEQVQREGAEISAADARMLVQYVGADQLRLAGEIAKLAAYNAVITAETIDLLVEKQPQDTIFQLLDYALSGKANQATKVLEGLERAHEDPYQVANMLIWQTHILAVVSSPDAPQDSHIAKEAKISPFVVKKTRGLAVRLTRQKLAGILDTVALLDIELKSSSANPWRSVESALLRL